MEELWYKIKLQLIKLAYFKKRSRLKRYGLPVLLMLTIFSLVFFSPKTLFQIINSQALSFLIFTVIVTVSAWYGGLGPGIMTTILAGIINYLVILRLDLQQYHSSFGDGIITVIWIAEGFVISVISQVRYEYELQKDEFIGLTAHELKNPLSVIKGYAQILTHSSKGAGQRKAVELAREIESQSDKLVELINDLLDVTRIGIGSLLYKDERFCFFTLVKEVIKQQMVINNKRKILLFGKTQEFVFADRYRIGQVITNLLTNAQKYSPSKSSIRVKIKGSASSLVLSVKDYGIGIPKKEQEAIFNQFYRARGTQRRKTEGLGLGLFISSQIARHYESKLWVRSNKNKGSTFYLRLPRKILAS